MSFNLCFCDYEAPEFFVERMRVARKSHKCVECRRGIAPGEYYEYTSGKWDGDFSVYKTCLRCQAVRKFVVEHVPCFCWYYGNMLEDARETIQHYAHELPGMGFAFGRLFLAATRTRK